MSESDLIRSLGEPDRRVADAETMKLYAADEHCPTSVSQVWVFERSIGDDIVVGLTADRRVSCAWDATIFEIVN